MKRCITLFFLAFINLSAVAQESPQTNLPRLKLQAGMYQIDAQVAQTPDQRSTGLMFRTEMLAHEGMLFVFEQANVQCFWMRNTVLPLSIAFIREDGIIANIADMEPMTDTSHCSSTPSVSAICASTNSRVAALSGSSSAR